MTEENGKNTVKMSNDMSPQHRGRRHSRKPLEKWKDYFHKTCNRKTGPNNGKDGPNDDDDDDDYYYYYYYYYYYNSN